ncbi:MAG TPA: hypothetical protein VF390_01290 [Patescibacteria group bacterium]
MKLLIPKNLPQFSDSPSLFISSGEYEAHFYLAHQGILEELESFKMPPREEDLKRKFQARVNYAIHSLVDEYQFHSIYLFSPEYVAKRIIKGLEPNEEEKIKMKFFGEFIKLHPLKLLKMFWKQIELLISVSIMPPITKEGAKIAGRPKVRHAVRG